MNHQNQLEQMANGAIFATLREKVLPFASKHTYYHHPTKPSVSLAGLTDRKETGEENQMAGEPDGLFAWLVADGWCWFVLREKY
jgi:hypothetical protein